MRRFHRSIFFAIVSAATVAAPVHAQTPSVAHQPAPSAADRKLKALYDGYAAWDAKESGNFQDSRGETKPADYLPRVDAATQQRRAAQQQEHLKPQDAKPVAQRTPPEKEKSAVFRTILENAISDAHFRLWEMPFNSDSNFWTFLDS
jgi:hypothetical protein